MLHPTIIQGGMGAGVSGWQLARAVSARGHLGVVSGTALDTILARRLQLGDPGGHLRRAFAHFPFPGIPQRVMRDYFIPGGKFPNGPFVPVPLYSQRPPARLTELTVLANFTEVFLAREGHRGPVGINLLEKIQLPTLASLFGAMLAGVHFVLMGAGIPRAIPGVLDAFSKGEVARLKLDVEGPADGEFFVEFDPAKFCDAAAPTLPRPHFLAIISSATLAMTLARKSTGRVDGFIVENASAGGHNAPPRGPMRLSLKGEPIYGDRDLADLGKIRALGLPFWLAGSFGWPGKIDEAIGLGACGIQVGTPFAFCQESGMDPRWKRRALEASRAGVVELFTDPIASPTGFPLKVVRWPGTACDPEIDALRTRRCDLGYLRHAYAKPDGSLGYRCPAEDVDSYVRKSGDADETAGRKCVCNGLLATIGLGQKREQGTCEAPLITAGDDIRHIAQFADPEALSYTAADVIDRLESGRS